MRTTEAVIESLLQNSSFVRRKNLSLEDITTFIQDYQDAAFSVLMDNGYIRLSKEITISLVKLKDRRYVLRGNSYSNHRKYKLKMVTSSDTYDKIENFYSDLLEV